MANSAHATFRIGVVLTLGLAIAWLGATGGTGAAAHWPSPPIGPKPTPTPTPAGLDEETLGRLTIFPLGPGEAPADYIPVGSISDTLQLVPGGSLALILGVYECCYFFRPVAVSAVWSVTPTRGASIDPKTGLLTVDLATPSGSVYTVSADVENGRRIVSTELHVFTPEANPLVGYWTETAQIDCATGAEVTVADPIAEFIFGADGTFSVTWFPFEVYKDYWGTYTFGPATGALELSVVDGNYVPSDFDGSGQFALDAAGRLVLTDIWLGAPRGAAGAANCGHIFAG